MKIYLATPYSHPMELQRIFRYEIISKIAAKIMSQSDHIVFSPISHTHPIAYYGNLEVSWDFWEKFDTAFIQWCDEVWVYKAKGWKESVRVQAEIKLAKKFQKPVVYLEENYHEAS